MGIMLKCGKNRTHVLAVSVFAAVYVPAPMAFAQTGDYEALNQAGQEAIKNRDYVLAERNFRAAREAALAAEQREFAENMDARRAAMYINDGEPSRALPILKPYIRPGVDRYMLADYLMALRLAGQPKEAVQVFVQLVDDWKDFPVYGLQTVGDIYLRQGKFSQAGEIYEHILSRDNFETVPFVQLGYAYSLARRGRDRRAVAEYGRLANLAPRYNDIIAGDAEAFLAEGRVGLARKMFGLLGADEREREGWRLRYARALVNAGQDYSNNALNFRRDEYLSDRSYYHEAARVLKGLLKSGDGETAHEAKVLLAANKLHHGMLADSRRTVQELLAEDTSDVSALAVQGEADLLRLHSLSPFYEAARDDKGNLEQRAGLSYGAYLGQNVYFRGEAGRRFLQDGETHASFWQGAVSLGRKFDWGQIAAEWIGYEGAGTRWGCNFSLDYDFNDDTTLKLEGGRRIHDHVGAVLAGISEKYWAVTLRHQLTPRTSIQGSYEWDSLSDDNKYRGYGLSLNHLLQVKHNFSDRLLASYSHGSYEQEMWEYDSPWRRQDYTLGLVRRWSLPRREAAWQLEPSLSWGRDNDERFSFAPQLRLSYTKSFRHGQSLEVGAAYRRYCHQAASRTRRDGYAFDISYSWEW